MIYSGRHSSIYFLITLMYCNLVRHAVEPNLYSEFNNELDKVSNYAENRAKAESLATLGEIYDHNGELLRKHLQNIQLKDVRNANKLNRNAEIGKLINVLSPYHEPWPGTYPSRKVPIRSSRDSHCMCPTKHKTSGIRKLLPRGYKLSRFKKGTSPKKTNLCWKHRKRRFGENPAKPFDPQSLLNTAASAYPNVVANLMDVRKLNSVQSFPLLNVPSDEGAAKTAQIDAVSGMNHEQEVKNALQQRQTSTLINSPFFGSASYDPNHLKSRGVPADQSQQQGPAPAMAPSQPENAGPEIKCALEKVLDELEGIKRCSNGSTPAGAPCDVSGSWNSEVMGLRFDISSDGSGLNVELRERTPAKRHTLMDVDWTCTGGVIKKMGGPFYINAVKVEENTMAVFSGLCKVCGDTDTIFGSWTVIQPAKSCEDVQLAIETRRDVFRRNNLQRKKKERLEMINKARSKDNQVNMLCT